MQVVDLCEKCPFRDALQSGFSGIRLSFGHTLCLDPRCDTCLLLSLVLALTACSGEIYLRDGVTDGDTFYLARRATADPDPVLQSWVSYSLTISACQLQSGSPNPARATSFDCELSATAQPVVDLAGEKSARSGSWPMPILTISTSLKPQVFCASTSPAVSSAATGRSRRTSTSGPIAAGRGNTCAATEPETHITGSWNYARRVGVY